MSETTETKKQEATKANWADDSDEEGADKEIGVPTKPTRYIPDDPPAKPKKDFGPPQDEKRNKYGDFVVTKIYIPDAVVPVVENQKNESDEESSEDEDAQIRDVEVEESKEEKAPAKKLSKKEQKKLEDEEFERVMAEMGVKDAPAQAEAKEAPKAAPESQPVDEKKASKNAKKR